MKRVSWMSAVLLAAVGLVAGAALVAQPQAEAKDYGQKKAADKMAATVDKAPAGLPAAPAFTLVDSDGNEHSLEDFRGKYVVLEWFADKCPFVKKFYESGKMQELQREYTGKGVVWLTMVSANPNHGYYRDAEALNGLKNDWSMAPTAILRDDTGEVGKAYKAKTTPHMYVINPDGKLIYQGAIDSIRSANQGDISEATNYVSMVLDANLLSATTPYGCSIKY